MRHLGYYANDFDNQPLDYSRPEERAQRCFRRLSQALKTDDDTDEEDEAGRGTWGAPQLCAKSNQPSGEQDRKYKKANSFKIKASDKMRGR